MVYLNACDEDNVIALREMEIAPAIARNDTETMHWQERERTYIGTLCREKGIEIEILGVERDDYSIPEYKAAMRAKEESKVELETLKSERTEQETIIETSDSKVAEGKEQIESQHEVLI